MRRAEQLVTGSWYTRTHTPAVVVVVVVMVVGQRHFAQSAEWKNRDCYSLRTYNEMNEGFKWKEPYVGAQDSIPALIFRVAPPMGQRTPDSYVLTQSYSPRHMAIGSIGGLANLLDS